MASRHKSKKSKVVGQVIEDGYLMEKILEKKHEGGVWKYLVKWVGWPCEESTWEPRDHLDCEMVSEFDQEFYSVEKILEKKLEGGDWKYLIKWVGWPSETNTWEPREHLNCDVILSEFEKQWEIDNEGQLSPELVPTQAMSDNPADESDLDSASSSSESDNDSGEDEDVSLEKTKNYEDFDVLEECPADKEPERVVGVVDLSGQLTYLVEWKKEQETMTGDDEEEDRNLINALPFKLKYPQLVIDFYAKHICFDNDPLTDGVIADFGNLDISSHSDDSDVGNEVDNAV